MIYLLLLLIYYILFYIDKTSSEIIIPIKEISKPESVNNHHLSCHLGLFHKKDSTSYSINLPSFHPNLEHQLMEGYLCSKEEHFVTCSTGFFETKTLTSGVNQLLATEYECEDAIKKDQRTRH